MRHVISEAIAFATKMHHGQFDKAGLPYILHPLKVMYLVKSDDEELMAVAVSHDVVEDCFASDHEAGYSALKAIGMTKRVIDAVRLLTKRKDQSYDEYIAGVLTNKDSIRVKMADIRHNNDLRRLKGITDKDFKRIEKYTRTYHRLKIALEAVDIL